MKIEHKENYSVVEVFFKLKSSKFADFATGLKDYLNKLQKNKQIKISYKIREKKYRTFYRIKIVGKNKDVLQVIKTFDYVLEQKGIDWKECIRRINTGVLKNLEI